MSWEIPDLQLKYQDLNNINAGKRKTAKDKPKSLHSPKIHTNKLRQKHVKLREKRAELRY